jgi:hypothetical protein
MIHRRSDTRTQGESKMIPALKGGTIIDSGGRVTIKRGEWLISTHPIVLAHPELFHAETEATRKAAPKTQAKPATQKPAARSTPRVKGPRIDRVLEMAEPRSAPAATLPGADYVFTDGKISFEVLLSPSARADIVKYVRSAGTGHETGGTLYGKLSQSSVVDVRGAIGPGPNCVRARSSFQSDPVYTFQRMKEIRDTTDYVELGCFHTHPRADDDTPSNNPGEDHGDVQHATHMLERLNQWAEDSGARAVSRYISVIVTPDVTGKWEAPTITPWRVSQRKDGLGPVGVRNGRELLSPGYVVERGRVL